MPHAGEQKGLYGAINLLTGEIGDHVRKIMERGMVAHKPRLSDDHISRLIRFTPYSGITGGPLELVKENGANWWPGWMVASDSSPVELSMGDETDWYHSNRVLLSTIVALDLDAQGVKKADQQIQSEGAVDPFWSKVALRKSGIGWSGAGQIFLVLPGNGILYRHEGAPNTPESESLGFRHAMEEMLRSAKTWDPDDNLWRTYTRLLCNWKPKNTKDPSRTIRYGHQEDMWIYFEKQEDDRVVGFLQACPKCRTPIAGGAVIGEGLSTSTLSAPGTFYACPSCNEQTRLIDACGLANVHSTEQSNLNIMNSFSVFMEHLLLYSWCRNFNSRQLWKKNQDVLYEDNKSSPIFVMDGPLALFGSCGRFARTFRREIQNAVVKGATVFGIVKTGKLRQFLDAMPKEIRATRASYFVIPDRVRYEMIEVGQTPTHYGFGEMSYYGQDIIARTRRGLSFLLSVATPTLDQKWWRREKVKESLSLKHKVIEKALTSAMIPPKILGGKHPFEFDKIEDWIDFNNQSPPSKTPSAPLWRVISTLEHIESIMFQQSSIPQAFAHMLAGTQVTLMKSYLKSISRPEQVDEREIIKDNAPAVSDESLANHPPKKPKM